MAKEKLTEITKREFEENFLNHVSQLEEVEMRANHNVEVAIRNYRQYVFDERQNVIRYYLTKDGHLTYTKLPRKQIGFDYEENETP